MPDPSYTLAEIEAACQQSVPQIHAVLTRMGRYGWTMENCVGPVAMELYKELRKQLHLIDAVRLAAQLPRE